MILFGILNIVVVLLTPSVLFATLPFNADGGAGSMHHRRQSYQRKQQTSAQEESSSDSMHRLDFVCCTSSSRCTALCPIPILRVLLAGGHDGRSSTLSGVVAEGSASGTHYGSEASEGHSGDEDNCESNDALEEEQDEEEDTGALGRPPAFFCHLHCNVIHPQLIAIQDYESRLQQTFQVAYAHCTLALSLPANILLLGPPF